MATPLQNRNNILALAEQRIKLLYTDAYTRAMKIAEVRNALNAAENVNFNFRAFPRAEKELNKIMGELSIDLKKMAESGFLTASKNGLSVATQRILAITASATAKDMTAEAAADNRFSQAMGTRLANAKRGGLTLSDRIWKTVQTSRNELEIIIQNNLIEGKGADVASREVRQYLNDPKKLFRRVKDKETGEYRLSKAAQQYHPGQGKYRSSYMNARRLIVTEMNMATQASECAAYADNPLIAGYEIRLSNNHTVKDPRHKGEVLPLHDICDELQGKYPPTFKFTGWHPHCYTADAMVLTARGWVKFADLHDDDVCLSLDFITKQTEYAPIVDRQRFEFHGDLVRFYNRSFECQVTPNHEVLYLNKNDGRFKRMAASEYSQYKGGIFRSAWNDRPDIEVAVIGGNTVSFDDFCEFMGYWLSDGSVATNRDSQIAISQKPNQGAYKAIIDVIERMGYTPKIGEQSIYMFDKALHRYLSQFGKCNEKFIPDEIKNASKRQIDIFLNAFVQCDGNTKKPKSFVGNRGSLCVPNRSEETYYTTSHRLMSDLCVCLVNAEYRPSVRIQKPGIATKKNGSIVKGNYPCYVIAKCYSSTTTQFSKGAVRYDGFVYDVTIGNESHAIYIMENGKCYWGSNCRCSMIPILISPDERRKLAQARAEGKTYQPKGVITDVPDNFKAWVAKNQDRIMSAKTLPFFLQDNGELTKDGYVLDEKFTDTPMPNALKVAEQRHAERTPEQAEAIRKRAEEREQQLKEYELLKKQSGNILNVAKDYGEVDYTDFENTLDSVNSNAIYHNDEMAALKAKMQATISQIQQQKAAEKSISDIIPDAHQWHKQFTMAELQKTKDSVTTTIDNWLKKYGYTSLDEKPSHAKAKLELEITNVVSSKKYSTWQVAESSYKKMLKPVADKVVFEQLSNDLASYASFKTKSTTYKSLLQQMSDAIANKDKIAAQIASDELKKKQQSLSASQSKSVADKDIKYVLSHTPKVQNTDKQKGHLPTGMTKAERVEKIKELTGVNDAVANDMNDAVNGFSYQWDYEIRQVQCGNNVTSKHGHSLQQICKKANDIEDFIAKSPQWDGGVTYRGISLSPKELDALRNDLKAGVGNMQGSASWSSKEQTSKGFSGFHIGERSDEYGDTKSVRVLLKTPSHYSATSIKHLSNFPGEDEIISSKQCRYKYVREYMDGPYLVIEVLPNN